MYVMLRKSTEETIWVRTSLCLCNEPLEFASLSSFKAHVPMSCVFKNEQWKERSKYDLGNLEH